MNDHKAYTGAHVRSRKNIANSPETSFFAATSYLTFNPVLILSDSELHIKETMWDVFLFFDFFHLTVHLFRWV